MTPADFPQMGKLVLGSTMDCPQRLVAHLLSRSPTLGSYMSRSVKETVFVYAICMSPKRKTLEIGCKAVASKHQNAGKRLAEYSTQQILRFSGQASLRRPVITVQ